MKPQFLYHAEAVGASGHITLPYHEAIEVQASVALPVDGGHAVARSERFRHRNILAFDRAESNVVGSHSALDTSHATLSSVVIEGLNIMNVVTCDRVVLRLTSRHDDAGGDPSFVIVGSYFDNLRIAGHHIAGSLATDLFSEYNTWTKLTGAYREIDKVTKEVKSLSLLERQDGTLPESKGTLGVTLARGLDQLPGGLKRDGQGIHVPDFGTVYLGELFISRQMWRLTMVHVDFGCSTEGYARAASGGGNGSFWP